MAAFEDLAVERRAPAPGMETYDAHANGRAGSNPGTRSRPPAPRNVCRPSPALPPNRITAPALHVSEPGRTVAGGAPWPKRSSWISTTPPACRRAISTTGWRWPWRSPRPRSSCWAVRPAPATAGQRNRPPLPLACSSRAGRIDIPVSAGRSEALLADNSASLAALEARSREIGASWAGMPALPRPSAAPSPLKAHEFIIDAVRRYPGEVTLVMEGALTNLALALLVDPEIASLTKAVFHMGGDIGDGWLARPERPHRHGFVAATSCAMNDSFDPHATEIAVRSGIAFTFMPASVCARVLLRPGHIDRIAAVGTLHHTFLAEASWRWVDLYRTRWAGDGAPMWDPLTFACAFAPDFCTYAPMFCDIAGAAPPRRRLPASRFRHAPGQRRRIGLRPNGSKPSFSSACPGPSRPVRAPPRERRGRCRCRRRRSSRR